MLPRLAAAMMKPWPQVAGFLAALLAAACDSSTEPPPQEPQAEAELAFTMGQRVMAGTGLPVLTP